MAVFRDEYLDTSNVKYDGTRILAYDKGTAPGHAFHRLSIRIFRRDALDDVPTTGAYHLADLTSRLLACGPLAAHVVEQRLYEVVPGRIQEVN